MRPAPAIQPAPTASPDSHSLLAQLSGRTLAVFVDQIFWFDGQVYSTDEAYILYPHSFTRHFRQVVFVGRLAPEPGRKAYVLNPAKTRFCPLPFYASLYQLWRSQWRVERQVRQIVAGAAADWDVAWIAGPNPIAQVVATGCEQAGVPFFLVVRQNLPKQLAHLNRGVRRLLAVAMASWLEFRFRRLARQRTVFTVGEELAGFYRRYTPKAHVHLSTHIAEEDLVAPEPGAVSPSQPVLLSVGRLSREKGQHILLEAAALLRQRGVPCRVELVGSGPALADLQQQARDCGLMDALHCPGYVAFGPDLFAFYRRASVLVVPSLSEGFPQVICEALMFQVPTVASAVGGIPKILRHRETAMLVPPGDVTALADALQEVLKGGPEIDRIRANGRVLMRDYSMESQRDHMAAVISQEVLCNT